MQLSRGVRYHQASQQHPHGFFFSICSSTVILYHNQFCYCFFKRLIIRHTDLSLVGSARAAHSRLYSPDPPRPGDIPPACVPLPWPSPPCPVTSPADRAELPLTLLAEHQAPWCNRRPRESTSRIDDPMSRKGTGENEIKKPQKPDPGAHQQLEELKPGPTRLWEKHHFAQLAHWSLSQLP